MPRVWFLLDLVFGLLIVLGARFLVLCVLSLFRVWRLDPGGLFGALLRLAVDVDSWSPVLGLLFGIYFAVLSCSLCLKCLVHCRES